MPSTRAAHVARRAADYGVRIDGDVTVDMEKVRACKDEVAGASNRGVEGDEVIHSILDVMYARQPYTLIQRAVHIDTTVSELIPTLLGGLEPLNP